MGAENTAFRIDVARQYDERAKHLPWSALRQSTLRDISTNFPPVDGYNFLYHLDRKLQKGPVAVFEFGGGADQSVALELFSRFNIGRYTAFEAQPLNEDARDRLVAYPQHRFVQGGVVDVDPEVVGRGEYDMVFANDVAQFLPDPALLLSKMHAIAKNDGLIFINGIRMRTEVVRSLEEEWKRANQKFRIKTLALGEASGVVELAIALKKTQDDLFIPEPYGVHLKNGSIEYANLDYVMPRHSLAEPSRDYEYVKYLVEEGIIGKGDQEAAEPVMTIFDAISHGEQLLHQ